jgi:hypothetical protein
VATGTTNVTAISSAVNTRVLEAIGNPIGSNTYRLQTVTTSTSGSGVRWRGLTLRGRIARSFTGGIWVKGIAGASLYASSVIFYSGGTSTTGPQYQFTANGGWQWITSPTVTATTTNDLDYVTIDVRTSVSLVTTFSSQGATVIDGSVAPTGFFDGSSTDSRWIGTADASTSIRNASLDRALMLEEATTNYAVNPYAVSTGGGYTASSATVVRTYLTDANMIHPDGAYIQTAARFTWSGVDDAGQTIATRTTATVAAESVAAAFLVRGSGSSIGKTFDASIYETGAVTPDRGSTSVVLTGAPQLVIVTATLQGGGTAVNLLGSFTGSVSGCIVDITGAQIEWKAFRTSLTPMLSAAGSPLTGYAWTGTANNSTSTRSASYFTTPVPSGFSMTTGSALIRAYLAPQHNAHEHTIWGVNYDMGGSGKDAFNIRISNAAGDQIDFWYQNTSGTQVAATAGFFDASAWNTIYVEWTATSISIVNPGGVKSTTARSGIANNPDGKPFTFGARNTGTPDRFLGGAMSSSIFFDRPLTDTELTIAKTMMEGWGISPP